MNNPNPLIKTIVKLSMVLAMMMVLVGCASNKTSDGLATEFQSFMNGERPEYKESGVASLDLALQAVNKLEANAFDQLKALKEAEKPENAEVFYLVENTREGMVKEREAVEGAEKLTDEEKDAILLDTYNGLSTEDRASYDAYVKDTAEARGTAQKNLEDVVSVVEIAVAIKLLAETDPADLAKQGVAGALSGKNPAKALANGTKALSNLKKIKSFIKTMNKSAEQMEARRKELEAEAEGSN